MGPPYDQHTLVMCWPTLSRTLVVIAGLNLKPTILPIHHTFKKKAPGHYKSPFAIKENSMNPLSKKSAGARVGPERTGGRNLMALARTGGRRNLMALVPRDY